MCITVYYVFTYLYAMLSKCQKEKSENEKES
ncbi:hypothetical protein T03_1203 [Trichinella britovi]|uniref:Uncharacterized protein n=1 Tax=Trichinella britovi TaxID=45882 RepID=A0A0V0ZJJ6_TRIBR|nr:hypothetical protein T03_1203 [Trichinella britovi]